ncbi:uncharacterized protein [Bombus flavifrons]|uniref:uncharacterized protein n=1 Tax=Bombus flavifrons TaxID=103934 RepID=UPI0037039EF4
MAKSAIFHETCFRSITVTNRCLPLASASTDFDENFSMYITDISLQNVLLEDPDSTASQEETDATISENNFICDTLEGGNETNKATIAENRISPIDVKQDSENLKKDSTPEFPATKTSSTVSAPLSATSFLSSTLDALILSDNKYAETVQTLDPVSRTCQEECIDEQNNLELATPKSSILTPTTFTLSNKQHAFGNTSTSQFFTSPTSNSKESVCDNAESRSTPFCWEPTTTTLSSPTFQAPTASQTLYNLATPKSSFLSPTTFTLSNKQHAFGGTSTSQFFTFPTSKSKESVCDNAESRSTPFCWEPTTTTTLSSPTFQAPTASQTLYNPATPKSSFLSPTTFTLSNKQHAFGATSTSQFFTSPTSKSKESVCDNAESRSTPFCWEPTTTTSSSPTFQAPTASQTLYNPATSKSLFLSPTTFTLSNKQHAFGATSTSQFFTSPTSKSKESVCDNAESRSTPFCWEPTTTTSSSPTFQAPTASQTLHDPATSISSFLSPTNSSLSNKGCEFCGEISCKSSTSAVLENEPTACDSAITNQEETTYNTRIGIPIAISTSFVTLSPTSVSGTTTFTMPTSESTPVIHVHQTFIFNGVPTEPAVMPSTLFNFSPNIIPAVSTQNQAPTDFSGYTFNEPNPELAAFPQYTTASSFSTSQPVTQSQQLSTSSPVPLNSAFNFDSPPGDCTAEPASIQSEGFNFNPPNTRPSYHFSVHKFNAPIQVQQGTASTQVRQKYRKHFRRLK